MPPWSAPCVIKRKSPFFCRILFAVDVAGKASFENADQLPFLVPVERHVIAGMPFLNAVKGKRKVRRAVAGLFAKIKIMHKISVPAAPAGKQCTVRPGAVQPFALDSGLLTEKLPGRALPFRTRAERANSRKGMRLDSAQPARGKKVPPGNFSFADKSSKADGCTVPDLMA